MTRGDGDAERAAKMAVADGCEALFVAGGDGTLNEAMNGVAAGRRARIDRRRHRPVRHRQRFRCGARHPAGDEPALEVLLEGRELTVDLGEVNGRVFVNTSGGGFIAEVSARVTPQLKTIAGRLAYLIGGAQVL